METLHLFVKALLKEELNKTTNTDHLKQAASQNEHKPEQNPGNRRGLRVEDNVRDRPSVHLTNTKHWRQTCIHISIDL